jgi:hypothetical protein
VPNRYRRFGIIPEQPASQVAFGVPESVESGAGEKSDDVARGDSPFGERRPVAFIEVYFNRAFLCVESQLDAGERDVP